MSHPTAKKVAPFIVTLTLAACGGGSSDSVTVGASGPTTAISAVNQEAVATEVSSNALQFTGSVLNTVALMSAEATPVETVAGINMQAQIRTIRDYMHQQAQPTVAQAVGAVIESQENCDVSGTVKVSFDDKNGSKDWDVGESGTAVFSNCLFTSDGLTLNGAVQDEYIAQDKTTTTDKFTFSNLKASKDGLSSELGGSMSYSESVNLSGQTVQSTDRFVTQDLTVKVSQNSRSENFTLNEDVSFAASSASPHQQTISGSGVITSNNSNINGSVKFDITTPIIVNNNVQPVTVTAGQMTISGRYASGGTGR